VAAPQRSEQVNPHGMSQQQGRAVLPKQISRLAGKFAVGDSNSGDDFRHSTDPLKTLDVV
jgi:hypothetical protein